MFMTETWPRLRFFDPSCLFGAYSKRPEAWPSMV